MGLLRCRVSLTQKSRNKGLNLRAKCLWAMRLFLFQRKIPCLPFWLACHSGYAFGVQQEQCISNYWYSWLASRSAVLKNMKCKLGSLYYPGFCYCCFCCSCCYSETVFAHFKKKKTNLILTLWMYSPLFNKNALPFLLMPVADSWQSPVRNSAVADCANQHFSWRHWISSQTTPEAIPEGITQLAQTQ